MILRMRPGVNDSHIVHLLPNILRVSGDALAVFHLAASSLALNAYTVLIEMPIIMVQKLRHTYQRSQLCFHFAETKSDHKCPRFSFFSCSSSKCYNSSSGWVAVWVHQQSSQPVESI